MGQTIGYHIVISGYGLWLPGDNRGHWSDAWDEQVGYYEPHTLHKGDPIRKRMAEERMRHLPQQLSPKMQECVATTLDRCQASSDWRVAAASIEATHTHLLLTDTTRDIDNTIKWLKDQITKSIHHETEHQGPIWCKGKWCSFIYEETIWHNTMRYIERHNERRGQDSRPYSFLT